MVKKKNVKTTVGFISLGCPKNVVDSEKMLALIVQAGFVLSSDIEQADVIVINTCGFIEPAKLEALEAIQQAVEFKNSGSARKVIVTGCLAQRAGEDLFEQIDGIDALVALACRDDIAEIITETVNSAVGRLVFLEEKHTAVVPDSPRLRINPGHWAYLRISEGCDHSCAFCTIPSIRGKFRSKPFSDILSEAHELVDSGCVELNLIAQDTAYYGKDLNMKDGLSELLGELEKIEDLKWIRLLYLYPFGITDKLIRKVADSDKIVNYFDLPIQHISNLVLKSMRRPDRKENTIALIEKLRKLIPDVVLRTTLITGFPGEREKDFNELLEFIEWVKFDCLGAFRYYPEEGTAAAEMADQVPDDIKIARLDKLMLCQQEIAFKKNADRVGEKLTCLVDSVSDSVSEGRFFGQAPDIDGICIIENSSLEPGSFVETEIIAAKDYDLIARPI